MSIEIIPFMNDHLEDTAALVATRYRAERDLNKSLPARFEDANAVLPLLRDYANGQTGIAAIRDSRLIGFLIGLLVTVRGVKTVYVPDWGHAADLEGGREIYRAMYANLAPRWVADEYFAHAITVLAHEREVMDAWFSLGFGLINIDALRDLNPIEGGIAEFEIRRAGLEDVDALMTLGTALDRHLATAPVFIPLIVNQGRKFYEELLQDSANVFWLAYQVGMWSGS